MRSTAQLTVPFRAGSLHAGTRLLIYQLSPATGSPGRGRL